MLLKADLWLLAKVDKIVRYIDRYFVKSGKHRPERIFAA